MLEVRKNTNRILLPDFPYKSNYIEINGVNIHFVAEGKIEAPTILFLHGVPTWSYTFRNIFPLCLAKGFRVIAPDLPGFGKSEKIQDNNFYTLENLVHIIEEFIRQLTLKHVVLYCHDWGAILGMIMAVRNSEHTAGIITSNGMLPVIEQGTSFQFKAWKWFAKYSPWLSPGRIVDFAIKRKLSKIERAGYDFPFSNRKEKTAIRILPGLVPLKKEDDGADLVSECWDKLEKWEKPFLTVFSDSDPITRGGERIIQARIPGAKNQSHRILRGKHFLQEDQPVELGKIIIEFAGKLNR